MENRILVVGGDRAAFKAAVKARIQNPEADVRVIVIDDILPYRDFAIPDFIGVEVKDFQVFRQRIWEYYKLDFDIDIVIQQDIKSILPLEKRIVTWDREKKMEVYHHYDTLILSTGSVSVYPSIEGTGLKNVFFGETAEELSEALKLIAEGDVRQVVIIGGNLKGIRMAQAFWGQDVLVTLVEEGVHLLPEFDVEIGALVGKHLMEKGIEVLTDQKVLTLIGNANGEVVEVHTPEHILACHLVIWITDREPNTQLAGDAGLPLEETGAIVVNEEMETEIPGIFAVGDCAAIKEDIYPMVLDSGVGKIFDLYIAKTGLSAKTAMDHGYKAQAVLVVAHDGFGYYSGSHDIVAMLVADQESRRLLGGQFLGEGPVDKLADFISALISTRSTVDQLAMISGHTTFMEVMSLAANVLLDKLDNRYETISSVELHDIMDDPDLIMVDTRTDAEVTMSKIPGSIHILLERLESRKEELEKEKTVVVIAKGDIQGRQAYGILKRSGFDHVRILEGGITAYPYELE